MNAKTSSFSGSDAGTTKPDQETIQISFIVPVYNVENYIRECVLSILELEGISFEIILVDDGSTDRSIEKIADLAGENAMITILRQENKGQSAARNRGLDLAKGDYIFFVDSDDKIDASVVQQVFSKKHGNEDMIIGDFYQWDGHTSFIKDYPSLFDHSVHTSGEFLFQRCYMKNALVVIWRNLYKRSFIKKHNLSFLEGAYYEDHDWSIRCLVLAKEVQYVNQVIYFYRSQRAGSTMNSPFSLKKYHDLFNVSQSLMEFASGIKDKKTVRIISLIVAYFLLPAIKNVKSTNLAVDHRPVLGLYKKLKIPFCSAKILQYILFFSERLFFLILKRKSI